VRLLFIGILICFPALAQPICVYVADTIYSGAGGVAVTSGTIDDNFAYTTASNGATVVQGVGRITVTLGVVPSACFVGGTTHTMIYTMRRTGGLTGTIAYTRYWTIPASGGPYKISQIEGTTAATPSTSVAPSQITPGTSGQCFITTAGVSAWGSCTGGSGSAGPTGATGPAGPTGSAGSNGAAGANGSAGATGSTGPTGSAGTNGSNGATGAAGATGTAGAVRATDLLDCKLTYQSTTILIVNACAFGYPNVGVQTVAAGTITNLGGSGTIYVYAPPTGAISVLHSGTIAISCVGCTDAGIGIGFPADVAKIGVWGGTTTPGNWNPSAVSDQRVLVSGPQQTIPDTGIRITLDTSSGIKAIGIDSAVVETLSASQAGQQLVCNATGTAGAQACTMIPSLTIYTSGMRIRLRSVATNVTTSTLNISSLGAISIVRPDGTTALAAGDLVAGNYYDLTYDGTAFRLQSTSESRDVKIIPFAAAAAGAAGAGVSYASGQWSPTARAGTYNLGAALQAVPAAGAALQFMVELPADWDTSIQPYINIFYGSGANTGGTAIWTVSSACSKQDGSTSDDPVSNAEAGFGAQTMAAANRMWARGGQFTAMTAGNNCVAGSSAIVTVAVSGTASAAINAYQAVLTIPTRPVATEVN
jgi:collagen type VII alpha